MKRTEDIERMSFEELEGISGDGSVEVPEGFSGRLEAGIAGLAAEDSARRSSGFGLRTAMISLAGAAAAVVLGVLTFGGRGAPADTFDDPRLAYAEVEKSFSLISEKLGKGAGVLLEAAPEFNRPKEILDKITGK